MEQLVKSPGLRRRCGTGGLWLILMIGLVGCSTTTKDLMTPREMVEFFAKEKYTVINLPSSLYFPAAVVEITEQSGVRWLGDGRKCFDAGVVAPFKATTPSWKFDKNPAFNAKLVANIRGVSAGPEFEIASKVGLDIKDAGVEALDIIQIYDWMIKNESKMSPACKAYLYSKNVFLIGEVYRVDKASYTLYDKSGAKLDLGGEKLKRILKLSADLKYTVTTNGTLEVSSPVYIAFRKVAFIGENKPAVLGDPMPKEPDADAMMKKYYEQNAEKAFGN